MPPESITFTFSIVTAYVMKAFRGGVISPTDFCPLSNFLQTQSCYDSFEELMAQTFIRRVPEELWSEMVQYVRQERPLPLPLLNEGLNSQESAIGTDGNHVLPEEESRMREVQSKALLRMRQYVDIHATSDCAPRTSSVDSHDPSLPKLFQTIPSQDKREWARLAIALSQDKVRLFLDQEVSLGRLLTRAVAWHLAIGMALGAVRTAAVMAQVVVLWILVRLANGDETLGGSWHIGWRVLISLVLPLGALVQSFGQHNTFHATNNGAIVARSLVLAMIYEKVRIMSPLYLSSASGGTREAGGGQKETAQKEVGNASAESVDRPLLESSPSPTRSEPISNESFTKAIAAITDTDPLSTGMLVNMISSDANTVLEASLMLPLGMSTLLDLAACLAWVSVLAGWATAILFLMMMLIFIFQVYCGYRVSKNKLAVALICDQRLRALTEFLNGIQVVKFYAWESNVRAMIKGLRAAEATLITQGNAWKLIGLTSTFCAPGLFYLCLFGVRSTYVTDMDAITTFTIMALLATNVNRTFQVLPRSLTVVGTTTASLKRISAFLRKDITSGLPRNENISSKAASPSDPQPTSSTPLALLQDKGLYISGDFGWPGFVLRDINLYCPPGSLTVVIGSVGSGKSTLLQAVMGMCAAMAPSYTLHLPKREPGDSRSPRIAYVAQEAFIAEGTVRENITFGLPFDEKRYRDVIKACSLVTDITQWGGDLVEVSANTLSGGQRQRLSLARACYSDADLFVVDDPISAVDATVGRHLLKYCFRGFLSNKTVLLSTHHPAPARFADQIVVLDRQCAKVSKVSASAQATPVLRPSKPHQVVDEKSLSAILTRLETESAASGQADLKDVTVSDDDEGGTASGVKNDSFVIPRAKEKQLDDILDGLLGKARVLKTKEAEAIGAVPASVYFSYGKGGGLALLLFTLLTFMLSQGFRTAGDWWFSAWTAKRYPSLSDAHYLGVFAAMVLGMIVASCVRTLSFGIFTVQASSSLHDRMFEAVIASPLHFFEQVPLGRIMNRFSKDLDYCDDLLPRVLFDLIQLVFLVAGSLSMQIYSVPWFAIAIPIAFVFFFLLLRLYMPASRYIKRIESTSRSPSLNTFQTVISGLTTLRMYGRMTDYRRQYYSYCDVTINAMLHSSCMQRWVAVRMDLISAMWALCSAVLCSALMFNIGPSVVGLCLSQCVFLGGLFQFAVRMATETEMMMTSVERLDEYGSLPPEEDEGSIGPQESSVKGISYSGPSGDQNHAHSVVEMEMTPLKSAHVSVNNAIDPQWPSGCDIIVKGLTVSHYSNPTVSVLKNLHFTIRAGQRVAVVGRTGAGKSTLLSAFFRTLNIPQGSIKIGGIGTTDVNLKTLRSRLGIIPQVPTLFHGTFRYNLDPFSRYSDAAMMEALAKVRLAEYVAARNGLDTAVGEGGGNLSVGQRQLLCAARVLLTGASILFMDEATANIDEATDAQIQTIVREESFRRRVTVVTIAHRLNTIMDYDVVLVLSQGRLVEVGNPRDLVRAKERFSEASLAHEDAFRASLGGFSSDDFTTDVQSLDERFCFASMVQAMTDARDAR